MNELEPKFISKLSKIEESPQLEKIQEVSIPNKNIFSIIEIHKKYEGKPILRGTAFSVSAGETVCLLGPSGSGKSTLLRIIAGLETAERGKVLWQGQDIGTVPVHKRNFSLMFQDYALFPHLNVYENVAFGLRMHRMSPETINKRVRETLLLVNMQKFAKRRVTELSGGEQQRVALARALAPWPKLLMLDEPLGALDRELKEQLSNELRALLHQLGTPTIYVTHDQEEAFKISDRIVIMHKGRVVQEGTAQEIVSRPASLWLAGFLGFNNQLDGQVVTKSPLKIRTSLGVLTSSITEHRFLPNQHVTVVLKDNEAKVVREKEGENVVSGVVEDIIFRGEDYLTKLGFEDKKSISFISLQKFRRGDLLNVSFHPEKGVLCYAR